MIGWVVCFKECNNILMSLKINVFVINIDFVCNDKKYNLLFEWFCWKVGDIGYNSL